MYISIIAYIKVNINPVQIPSVTPTLRCMVPLELPDRDAGCMLKLFKKVSIS